MSIATTARGRRFPLLVGTRALRVLATAPSLLLFACASSLLLTVSAADIPLHWVQIVAYTLSLFAMLLCLSPLAILAQLDWVIEHVGAAIDARACDLELDGDDLRVHGGPSHGFHAKLSDLAAEGAITFADGRLRLKPSTGASLTLNVPADPDERASLEALAASLSAGALARGTDRAPEPRAQVANQHTGVDLLRCSTCGAPLTPSRNRAVRCAFCNAENTIPSKLASRIESNEVVDARRRADEALCSALLRQPGPALANTVAFVGAALCIVLTAIAIFLAAMMAFLFDTLGGPPHWAGIALAECGLAVLLFSFVRAGLASRTAMRVLTLGFSSIPSGRAGVSDGCRNCGAPLPESAAARVLIRCVYCGADNLGALDLGFEADVVKRFSAGELSPASALARVRRHRIRARLQGFVGAVLLGAGIAWQLESPRPLVADVRTVTLPSISQNPYSVLEAGPGAQDIIEEARVPGFVLAILPNGPDVDLIVASAAGERRRLRAPHGQLSASDLAGAERVPTGHQYAAGSASDPLIVTGESTLFCSEPNGQQKLLYGGGLLADTLIEDPESKGGCSALVTTRAGEYGHFHVRELDGSNSHTLLLDASQPALAPDGRTLAVSILSQKSGVFELALFTPGSAPRLLTHGPIHAGHATWSPDGRHIAFLTSPVQDFIQFSKYTGATELFVLDLDGHLSQITQGGEPTLVRPIWSSRGIYIVKDVSVGANTETQLLRMIPK